MTKYILNSGGLRNRPDLARIFFQEVVNGLGPKPVILICFFALMRQEWEEKFNEYSRNYRSLSPEGVFPEFELAFPETFSLQVKKSDVVLIQGGDDILLQYWLRQFDLPVLWSGKTVVGNSAGSNALVTCFWTCDWRTCLGGLGILPIKFLAHYKSNYGSRDPRGIIDWERAYSVLKMYGNQSMPIHALEEGKYIVIER